MPFSHGKSSSPLKTQPSSVVLAVFLKPGGLPVSPSVKRNAARILVERGYHPFQMTWPPSEPVKHFNLR